VSDINEQCTNNNIDTCWSGVAQGVGIDVDQIDTCLANEIDTILMAESILTTSYGITGSPTMLINGEKYMGQRTSEDLKTALCCAFNTAPEECSELLSDETQGAEGSC
jgi:2-hydroxychromene-2-carboxylate isomerase